jgi:hypothetical protein
MGITQGRILLPSLNLRFGATPMVSIVTWVMFPEELAPTVEEGGCLRWDIAGLNRLNSSPTHPQGWLLDAEKALVGSLFQLSAYTHPRSPAIQLVVHQVPVMSSLVPTPTTRTFLDSSAKLSPY